MTDRADKIERHIPINGDEKTAIDWLADNCPNISKQKLKQAMQCGAVWLSHDSQTTRLRRAKKKLLSGETLHLYYDEKILFEPIQPAQLIADEDAYSIWNKPCGMFSQGTKWGDHSSICRWVEMQGFPQRPTYLIHRLDRATNGLILVGHKKNVASKLAALFEERKIEKHYRALVQGEYPSDSQHCLLNADINGKTAQTRVLENQYISKTNQSLLLLAIDTGRKHQIRKHLAGVGYPIIGDRQYGNNELAADSSNEFDLQLQSCYLAFRCPITDEIKTYRIEQDRIL